MFEETDNNQEHEHNNQSPGMWAHCLSFLVVCWCDVTIAITAAYHFSLLVHHRNFGAGTQLDRSMIKIATIWSRDCIFFCIVNSHNAIKALSPREGCLDLPVCIYYRSILIGWRARCEGQQEGTMN